MITLDLSEEEWIKALIKRWTNQVMTSDYIEQAIREAVALGHGKYEFPPPRQKSDSARNIDKSLHFNPHYYALNEALKSSLLGFILGVNVGMFILCFLIRGFSH